MKNARTPLCSIIILNYNGELIIKEALASLMRMNFPKDLYEVIVVDNDSKDNSKELIDKFKQRHSNIKTIYLSENLGFSGGNNIGIKASLGKYVCLLNNDCIVEKNWLREIIKTAEKDPKIFAVNSKILVYQRFMNLRLALNNAFSLLFIILTKSYLLNFSSADKPFFLNFYKKNGFCQVDIPYDPINDREIEFSVSLNINRNIRLKKEMLKNILSFQESCVSIIGIKRIKGEIEFNLKINLSGGLNKLNSLDQIQNAGIMVFQDGYGRDIGAIVTGGRQLYEYDKGQYNKEKEIYAACGAAVLYNNKIIKEIGYLDESFFMYYEDVEICERARMRGYKSVYCPKAIVRHLHALSSKEGSPFFFYHVEKGRLLHIFYIFPFKIFIQEYFKIVLASMMSCFAIVLKIRELMQRFKRDKIYNDRPKFIRRIQLVKVLLYFIWNSPRLILNRMRKRKMINRNKRDVNYLNLLEGRWYFK